MPCPPPIRLRGKRNRREDTLVLHDGRELRILHDKDQGSRWLRGGGTLRVRIRGGLDHEALVEHVHGHGDQQEMPAVQSDQPPRLLPPVRRPQDGHAHRMDPGGSDQGSSAAAVRGDARERIRLRDRIQHACHGLRRAHAEAGGALREGDGPGLLRHPQAHRAGRAQQGAGLLQVHAQRLPQVRREEHLRILPHHEVRIEAFRPMDMRHSNMFAASLISPSCRCLSGGSILPFYRGEGSE